MLLAPVDPEQGNQAVVQQFGHKRYKYQMSYCEYVNTVQVSESSSLQPLLIVIYPYWLNQTFGVQSTFESVGDDHRTHSTVRLFSVKTFNILSGLRQLLLVFSFKIKKGLRLTKCSAGKI